MGTQMIVTGSVYIVRIRSAASSSESGNGVAQRSSNASMSNAMTATLHLGNCTGQDQDACRRPIRGRCAYSPVTRPQSVLACARIVPPHPKVTPA